MVLERTLVETAGGEAPRLRRLNRRGLWLFQNLKTDALGSQENSGQPVAYMSYMYIDAQPSRPSPQTCEAAVSRHQASKQPEPRRLGMARSVSPTRAGSPGRKSASRGKPDAIVGLSEDELKSFAGSGSLPIDEDELSAAFDFFDVEGRGKLTVADLKLRLGAFYKNLPVRRRLHCHLGCQPAPARPAFACPQPKEYKTLINEPNFTKETLKNLLANNELGQFDPVKEAFKVYDPHGAPHASGWLHPHPAHTS